MRIIVHAFNSILVGTLFLLCASGFKSAMGKDYYEILGIRKDASLEDIQDRYWCQAKKWNPDIEKDPPGDEDRFLEVTEAYDVLSDPKTREIYDKYGEEGLKGSITNGSGDSRSPYTCTRGSRDTFDQFKRHHYYDNCHPKKPLVKNAVKAIQNWEQHGASNSAGRSQFNLSLMESRRCREYAVDRKFDVPLLESIFNITDFGKFVHHLLEQYPPPNADYNSYFRIRNPLYYGEDIDSSLEKQISTVRHLQTLYVCFCERGDKEDLYDVIHKMLIDKETDLNNPNPNPRVRPCLR